MTRLRCRWGWRFGLGVLAAVVLSGRVALARAAENPPIDPDAYYAVTYELTEAEVQTIKPAKVLGVVTIGVKAFLAIDVGGPQKAIGYLELDRVRTILPVQGVFSLDHNRESKRLSPAQ